MALISRKIEIDYGHTLPNHYGFCNQIHGHRATILCFISGEIVTDNNSSEAGMIIDFGILKKLMIDKIHSRLDHGFAVWERDKTTLDFIKQRNNPDKILILSEPPTAETLSKWVFHELLIPLLDKKILLEQIHWYETPNSVAYYYLSDYFQTKAYKDILVDETYAEYFKKRYFGQWHT